MQNELMKELIEKVINGNIDAYKELIRLVEKELYYIAKLKLGNDEDANDAVSQCIYKAYVNISKLREKEKFKPWIREILINECKAIYNKNNKSKKLIEKVKTNNVIKFSERIINKVDDELDFKILISKLKDKEQVVLTLYYKYDCNTNDIAKILNENASTIKSRLNRAENKLRKMLKEEDNNGTRV